MMNYSKSMKQIFRRLIPYIAVTCLFGWLSAFACLGQTESITPMAQTTSAPIPKEPEPQIISIAKEGVTIAADISVLPYGTKVIIDGHQYIVQDRGGSIEGNRIDIYFESHQAALEWGVQYKELFTERGENND